MLEKPLLWSSRATDQSGKQAQLQSKSGHTWDSIRHWWSQVSTAFFIPLGLALFFLSNGSVCMHAWLGVHCTRQLHSPPLWSPLLWREDERKYLRWSLKVPSSCYILWVKLKCLFRVDRYKKENALFSFCVRVASSKTTSPFWQKTLIYVTLWIPIAWAHPTPKKKYSLCKLSLKQI